MKTFQPFSVELLTPGYSVIDGRQYFVYPESLGYPKETEEQLYAARIMLSPFMAGTVEKSATEEELLGHYPLETHAFMREEVKKIQPGQVIMIDSRFMHLLKPAEIMMLIGHEEGHIQHGHLSQITDANSEQIGEMKLMVDQEKELEADAYSAEIFGHRAYGEALMKVLVNMGYEVGTAFEAPQAVIEEKVANMKKNKTVVERMVALGCEDLLQD